MSYPRVRITADYEFDINLLRPYDLDRSKFDLKNTLDRQLRDGKIRLARGGIISFEFLEEEAGRATGR